MKHSLIFTAFFAAPLQAQTPVVVTDILPVYSIVSQVVGDVGDVSYLIPSGADPHHYSLRPSDAQKLSDAGYVIWVGEALTPWLEKPLDSLASDAKTLELLHGHNEDGHHDDHEHDEEHGHDGHHGHDEDHDHDEHAHDEDDHDGHAHEKEHHDHEQDHEDHDHETHGHEAHGHDGHHHDHGGIDPHLWLDPADAIEWMEHVAEFLSEHDPEHATIYAANAIEGIKSLMALDARLKEKLAPFKGQAFMAQHDAYGHFADHFGLNFAGALTVSEAVSPSPADVQRVRDEIAEHNVQCVFAESQLDDKLLRVAIEGQDINLGRLDPLGGQIEPGPTALLDLLEKFGDQFEACLSH